MYGWNDEILINIPLDKDTPAIWYDDDNDVDGTLCLLLPTENIDRVFMTPENVPSLPLSGWMDDRIFFYT